MERTVDLRLDPQSRELWTARQRVAVAERDLTEASGEPERNAAQRRVDEARAALEALEQRLGATAVACLDLTLPAVTGRADDPPPWA